MSTCQLSLRPMAIDDLPAVMDIEHQTFLGDAWPASVYRRDLNNPLAFYYILELIDGAPGNAADRPRGLLLGYAGFWIVDLEAHLMTIAIDPRWQGRGLGEWFLLDLFNLMEAQGAQACTLEVRVSNHKARSLYRRLGFQVEGKRRRYYNDNGEDALIMTTPLFGSPEMQEMRTDRRDALCLRIETFLAGQLRH